MLLTGDERIALECPMGNAITIIDDYSMMLSREATSD